MRICLTMLLLSITNCVMAQNLLLPIPNQFQTSFTKQNITWDWYGNLSYQNDFDRGLGVRFADFFHSNLISPDQNIHQWRDENKMNGYIYHKYGDLYNGFYFDSWYLKDRQTLTTTNYANHAAGYKAHYLPLQYFSFAPYIGYQKSENRDIIDYGWDTGLDARLTGYPLGNYSTDARLQSDFDFYPARQNASNVMDVHIKTRFSAISSDSLAVNYSMNNQEYFAQNGLDLIHLEIENRSLHNFLYYASGINSRFEMVTMLASRNIHDDSPLVLGNDDVPNQRVVMRIENHFNYRADYSKFNLMMGVHTFQETQDNQKVSTDSKSLHTSLITNFLYRPDYGDEIDLRLSFIKFQYETPDSITNNDDRDEIRFIGQLNYLHRFSPLLLFNLEFYANFFHKMYIFEEQSANNNWNRIYRLGAGVSYNYNDFSNTVQTYVLANYTVYDFDRLFSETRSFVFRKYVLADSLRIPLINDFVLAFYGRLELEDRGTFFTADFTQRVLESGENIFYDVFLQKRQLLRFTMDLGLTVYRRRGWRHFPNKVQDREIYKFSPYIRVLYPFSRKINLRGYLALTRLEDRGWVKNDYATGNLTLLYYF